MKITLKNLIREIITEITKKQATQLKTGDKVWYYYSGLSLGSVEVEFVEFKPAVNKNQYDIAVVKTNEPRLNPDKNGFLNVKISHLYTVDPEMEKTTPKKGFLNKGVHGPRKWG